jgi:signal transduction histidine kinase
MSGRRSTTDLRAAKDRGHVEHAAAYNSIFRAIERPDITPLLKLLVEESAAPLRAVERAFAADATGFATQTYVRWFDYKHGEGLCLRTARCPQSSRAAYKVTNRAGLHLSLPCYGSMAMGAEQPMHEVAWLQPEQVAGLLDFWRVYDANYDTIIAATAPIIERAPESGVVRRSLSPDAMAAVHAHAHERLRRAIEEGEWTAYEDDLCASAVEYARRGFTLAAWHETASTIVCFIIPLLLRAYRDEPRRVEAAILALQRLNDRRAIVLGEHFLRTKEEMAREAEAALRRSEAELRSSETLAAIGKLAGSVAHDFNNLLAIIVSHADLLRQRVAPDRRALDDIEQIQRACSRATDLGQQLLIFGRQQLTDSSVLDLSDVVQETERMLRPVLGAGVEVRLRLTRPLDGVKIDRGSVEQVITNLVVNARDAMPNGGRLTLTTAEIALDRKRGHDGKYVTLTVTDSGMGMDAATRARVFEPFFTTKGPGKGTGLGLATVHGIVEQAGGFVEVRSEPGEGTTFEVYLPSVPAAARG